MIIAQLVGGLGNQLFQYAMARAVAYRNREPLGLDISQYQYYPDRDYRLSHFNIQAHVISPKAATYLTRQKPLAWWRRGLFLARHGLPLHHHEIVAERADRHFDPSVFSYKNALFRGYWQSEKYFKDIGDILRKELTLKHEPDMETRALAQAIATVEAVSLHVRRGDYVTDPATYQYHGVCSLQYYKAAIDWLIQKVGSFQVFVFSDDIPWTRKNLDLQIVPTFVELKGTNKDYEELYLMSQCKHHIIANSTFSWWGAWLSQHPEKHIIAPQKWFQDAARDTTDLIPDSWHRI